jgi:AraC family transcriptional regulator of adaptative response/methylated-DNA-[protein]-cysteine methyltransferase
MMKDEERYWQAVVERDRAWDGRFVYAVASTRIFCRPSCPARRPRREGVAFFDTPATAERAGFRACRRCRPAQTEAENPAALVERACRAIETALADDGAPPSVGELAARLGVGPTRLRQAFGQVIGVTPRQYAEAARLAGLKARLKEGETVTTALYGAGYGSTSRLYERAPERLGMTPGAYARGGAGTTIRYTIADAGPLGRLMVAATERGLCAISFGDDEVTLTAALAAEYPAAAIERDDAELGEAVTTLLAHLEGRRPALALPLDVRATAFQRRVWEELRRIPYGETRSYGQVAAALGEPAATRAVAQACAANPTALAIPCHRVVRADGALGGYRWGVARKQALLGRERAAAS